MRSVSLILLVFTYWKVTVQADDSCFVAEHRRPNENVTFWQYTRSTDADGIELPVENIEFLKSKFSDKSKLVKILIHGYTSNHNDNFNQNMRKALLEYQDMYVISVDWNPLTKRGCRPESSLNLRVVGNCTAQLIDTLVQHVHIPLRNIHVIGFSMGGQTTGFISRHMSSGQVHHITALDPTLPFFNTTDLNEKLDKSDGEYIDVYHTSAGSRGQREACGHADFYMNGGANQPGCAELDSEFVGEDKMSCSHRRAPAYYTESIQSKVGFYGVKCEDAAELSSCPKRDFKLSGYHIKYGTKGVYNVKTSRAAPYALGKEI